MPSIPTATIIRCSKSSSCPSVSKSSRSSSLLLLHNFGSFFPRPRRAILFGESLVVSIPHTVGRARLQQTPAGLRIVIPPLRSPYLFLEGPVIAVLVVSVLRQLDLGTVVWVMIGTLLAAGLGRRWLWNLVGNEIVTINKVALTMRYDFGGLGWQRTYFLHRLYSLCFVRLMTAQEMKDGTDDPLVGFVGFNYEAPASRIESLFSVIAGLFLKNWGVTYVMCMMAGVLYYLGTLLDDRLQRCGVLAASLFFLGVAVLALAGYRYRFTRDGVEIFTLGFRVRFIPVDRIMHWEESGRTYADSYSFGLYGTRKAYVWAGRGVRIHTLDGEFFIGHMKPEILLRDLELMKQAASGGRALGQAAGAGK